MLTRLIEDKIQHYLWKDKLAEIHKVLESGTKWKLKCKSEKDDYLTTYYYMPPSGKLDLKFFYLTRLQIWNDKVHKSAYFGEIWLIFRSSSDMPRYPMPFMLNRVSPTFVYKDDKWYTRDIYNPEYDIWCGGNDKTIIHRLKGSRNDILI